MKKIISTLIITLLIGKLYADGGNCVRYQIGITLINDNYIEGFVYENNYQPRFKFDDINIKDFIFQNCLDKENELTVYLKVKELIFPKFPNFRHDCDFHLNGTSPDNLRKINSKDIKGIKLIEYNTCHNCDKYDLKDGFYWVGIYPNVITELTNKEIDLLQTEPVSTNDFYYPVDEYSSFKVLSYNDSIDSDKLKKLCDDYLQDLQQEFDKNNWEIIHKKYDTFKQELRTKDIIIFKIGFIP